MNRLMLSNPTIELLLRMSRSAALVGTWLFCPTIQSAMATEKAEAMYQQCRSQQSTARQRDCYPAVLRQAEIELAAAGNEARADLVELESISEGSRAVHPVLAFDDAARAFGAFRDAESRRVRASYGSGNGGDLAAYATSIEMTIARARQLAGEAGARRAMGY
ncbi:uncharacterized protein YecT (DUF1311 family) [Paraburkholderia atlantica]